VPPHYFIAYTSTVNSLKTNILGTGWKILVYEGYYFTQIIWGVTQIIWEHARAAWKVMEVSRRSRIIGEGNKTLWSLVEDQRST
jgi:hypothetical protein